MKKNYFNFKKHGDEYLITNDGGRFCFLSKHDFNQFVKDEIPQDSVIASELMKNGFLYNESDLEFSACENDRIKWNKGYLFSATALHIFVVTTECNLNCVYCQANSRPDGSNLFMSDETARRAVDIALQSPEHELTFEFQGGEPLMNFSTIKTIVEYAEENKGNHELDFSLVSNLTLLTDEIIDFIKCHNINVSTSIDGSEKLHDKNRHYTNGQGSFKGVKRSLEKLSEAGIKAGAIETTTKFSLDSPEEIVNEYRKLGFNEIFLRPLTPIGRAGEAWGKIGYSAEEFLEFYRKAFESILELNREGIFFKENFASILLKKIFGQYINYMELRSPCGAGLGQLAYYADGNVYTCDEGRMLSEMGANDFCLGNVYRDSYRDIVSRSACRAVCASGILESTPCCCDCVYVPFCGLCPVVNFALYGDIMVKTPESYRCRINKGILDFLFEKIKENAPETMEIFRKWVD